MIFDYIKKEHLIYEQEIINFAKKYINKNIIKRDKLSQFDKKLWLKCGELGLLGLPVSKEYGGQGLSAIETIYFLEVLGYASKDSGLNFSICAHILACIIPILNHGSQDQKLKFLPKLCSGEFIAVNGITETDSGSDVYSMNSKAILNENSYILNGSKTWGTNAPISNVCIFYAKTASKRSFLGGFTAFILEKEKNHYSCSGCFDKIGLKTSPIGQIFCDNVVIPKDNRLGDEGKGGLIFSESMNWERICIAACHNGTIKRMLEIASNYAKYRIVGGKKIINYQAISHKIAEIKIKYEASKLLTYNSALKLKKDSSVSLHSSINKVFTSEALFYTASEVIQILGANGIITDYEIERDLRDSIASKIYSGTNEIHRNIIAKWVTSS